MAKVVLENGMVFEGTNDELIELFTKLGAKIPAVEEAPTYRKVTDREARVGDYVKFSETEYPAGITLGKYYEISGFDSDNDPEFNDDDDDGNVAVNDWGEDFEIYEKVDAEPAPLKVGDYAKVISVSNAMAGFDEGDIVQVSGKSGGEHKTEISKGRLSGYGDEGVHFVRIAAEEVAEAKRQQAEKAVAAKWASINRKPNEFKKGDIVRGVRRMGDGRIVEGIVEDVDKEDAAFLGIKPFNEVGGYYAINATELISPVEARFDR